MDGYLMLNQIIEAMSHQGNKLILLFFAVSFLIVGCSKRVKYNEKEMADIRERTLATSQSILGKEAYFAIYQMANDSILNWSKNELGLWKHVESVIDYQLDSVFCVNKEANKIVFSIPKRDMRDDAVMDGISYFYGIKIRNTWYFLDGADLLLPRESYQKDIHVPLSFEKLKQIATSKIYRRYLKKGKKGEWEINDNFFSDLTSVAWCTDCVTQEQWDAAYLRVVGNNWRRKK